MNTTLSLWQQLRIVISSEFRNIFHDKGVLLVLLFAPIIYATIYSLAYGAEVLREVPIGIIDNSHTSSSRHLAQMLDMGPNTHVAYMPGDMAEAERLFFNREIYGILYIPEDYERQIMSGSSAKVAIYLDASYMLFYRQVYQELVESITTLNYEIELLHLTALGVSHPQAATISRPVIYHDHTLFNPYLGYGTFVMPPVLMLILQQTLLIGIAMIGATWRERQLSHRLILPYNKPLHTIPIVAGKAITYASLYAVIIFYLLNVHYRLFHYPMRGSGATLAIFIGVYIFAVIFMGTALSTLFKHRESPLMLMLWTSIPLLMLSGVSFPRETMPQWLASIADIFPSTFATRGFVKIATEGASLRDVMPELKPLILLCVIYFTLACSAIHHMAKALHRPTTNHPQHS